MRRKGSSGGRVRPACRRMRFMLWGWGPREGAWRTAKKSREAKEDDGEACECERLMKEDNFGLEKLLSTYAYTDNGFRVCGCG